MGSEKFCLRWNDFETNISSAFRELRDDKDFFDVTIACDDEQIQAHKVILSACSPFFRNILRRNPHQHPLLYLKGVKYTDLQSVLNFMYHGEVNVAQEELNSFLAVAEDLRVKGLTQNQSQTGSSTKKDPPPNLPPPAIKTTPRSYEREQVPPPKRSRPLPLTSNSTLPLIQPPVEDDIQEVVPVKTEPRDHPVPAGPAADLYQAHPHPAEQGSQALQPADDQALAYQEENYEEYNYGEEQGYEVANMGEIGLEGNKGGTEIQVKEPSDLNQYVSYDPTEEKYFCQICEKFTFRSRYNVRNHVEAVHFSNVFSYPCSLCDKAVGSKNALSIHMTRMHKK